jgi:hypothetical protein
VTAALTYGLAAVHKLNDAFFDPATSCADHAIRQVVALWPSLPAPLASPGLAALVVLWEALLALLVLTRSRWLWPVGLAFHLPLTLTLAPAFGAVMVAGWAAGMPSREVVAWRRVEAGLDPVGWRWRWCRPAGRGRRRAASPGCPEFSRTPWRGLPARGSWWRLAR